ncbi:MAG TPA: hypothetical protein VGV68_11760 [Terriglobia bacterium]|nr:hypothetical protein [Terriglobia bacterium]
MSRGPPLRETIEADSERLSAGGIELPSAEASQIGNRQKYQKLLAAQRQPILHQALEQDRVVRPKLLARAAPEIKIPGRRAPAGRRSKKP